MAFLEPKLLQKFYKLITEEFGNDYEKFFQYFQKQWINVKKLGKYTPIWNYYCCISNLDFDIKYIFLTNNLAENINTLLNSFFNKKYPLFAQWKNAILSLEITRRNYSSNLML